MATSKYLGHEPDLLAGQHAPTALQRGQMGSQELGSGLGQPGCGQLGT